MNETTAEFLLAEHVREFDQKIDYSTSDYHEDLMLTCVEYSRRFVQHGTSVLDIGCSTGRLLSRIRKANQAARPDVIYVGIDIEPSFSESWDILRADNLCYQAIDARNYPGYENASLCLSLFTVQFIRPADKIQLLRRIHSGLVDGGALIIAEKTLAETSRFQDAKTFFHYDRKLENGFSEKEIMDKERSLRCQMTLWTEGELRNALREAGFTEMQELWRSHAFVGLVALK